MVGFDGQTALDIVRSMFCTERSTDNGAAHRGDKYLRGLLQGIMIGAVIDAALTILLVLRHAR